MKDARWEYTWDVNNRLVDLHEYPMLTMAVNAGLDGHYPLRRIRFAYDYLGRRIAKTVWVYVPWQGSAWSGWRLEKDLRYVYDGWQMIAELDHTFAPPTAGWQPAMTWPGNGLDPASAQAGFGGFTGISGVAAERSVVRTYLWGQDLSGTMTGAGGVGGLLSVTHQGVTYHTCSDANGNITGLIAANGADAGQLIARFDYDPFGNRLTNTGPDVEICPMGFSSKYTDSETGQVYYGFRYYSPKMGRFLSRDPIEEQGGINLYGFVGNDPVNRWDYLGLATVEVELGRDTTGYFAVYGNLTAKLKLDSDSEKKKFECCSSLFPISFKTLETVPSKRYPLMSQGTRTAQFLPEDDAGRSGSTSIRWKLQRGYDQQWWVNEPQQPQLPTKPSGMSDSDYNEILDLEFHMAVGDGRNVHFGPDTNHSTGCVLVGSAYILRQARFSADRFGLAASNGAEAVYTIPGFGLQDSITSQFKLLEAIQCARKKGARVKFKVKNAVPKRDPEASAMPDKPSENGVPRAIPYNF